MNAAEIVRGMVDRNAFETAYDQSFRYTPLVLERDEVRELQSKEVKRGGLRDKKCIAAGTGQAASLPRTQDPVRPPDAKQAHSGGHRLFTPERENTNRCGDRLV